MTAHELIESYVAAVAVQLPRKQRNDVAYELRALLQEELQAKADAIGCPADAAMATELLKAFGPPDAVAARYLPTITIIDPADGRKFLHATVIGLAVIWGVGLLLRLRQPLDSGWDLLNVLGQWCTATVIPSLWWPGVLVVFFGIAAWVRRQWPHTAEWKPLGADHIQGGRAGIAMALVGMVLGIYILSEPRWVLDVLWGGRAAPVAYQALTYTDSFLQGPALYLFTLVLLNIPFFARLAIQGRWTPTLRSTETALSLCTCAAMAWAVVDGPIFMTANSDAVTKFLLLLLTGYTLLHLGIQVHRSVKPAPSQQLF
ncbi:MAG: hypothetical protein CFE44_14540 [Burkholderiales bacterium PBB4]|nr:MAG: hypothetical protein CFE44_14540 [Burkholderiales bacterium PBB4]